MLSNRWAGSQGEDDGFSRESRIAGYLRTPPGQHRNSHRRLRVEWLTNVNRRSRCRRYHEPTFKLQCGISR